MSYLRLFICLLPVCALFGLDSLGVLADDDVVVHSRFCGVYVSHLRSPSMNVSLGTDGSATVTEDPGNGARTLFGHWADSGGQVTVTFDAAEGAAAEPAMVFQPAHDGLQAVTWNHAAWGKVAPPPMKKGFKVKELYWFSENR